MPLDALLKIDSTLLARVRGAARTARSNREEKGLETLALAVGLATWETKATSKQPRAMVLLLPLTVEGKGASGSLKLQRAGDLQINPLPLNSWQTEFGVSIAEGELAHLESEYNPEMIIERLKQLVGDTVRGLHFEPLVAMDNFSFQKMAMVAELRNHLEQVEGHPLVKALAGDAAELMQSQSEHAFDADNLDLDTIAPQDEHFILDADASQIRAIMTVLRGQSLIITGPPGTGKSQTIANLLAALAADGKRALFVAEKRVALDVVCSRLEQAGLGHLLLDLHGGDVSRKTVMGCACSQPV